MNITLLLDHHLEDRGPYLQAGLCEIGWNDLLILNVLRLRDVSLPDDCPDDRLWRFVQRERIWLLTSNRNRADETSLQATIEREGTLHSLPVLTLAHADLLPQTAYRQRVLQSLVEILVAPELHYGRGRVFLP